MEIINKIKDVHSLGYVPVWKHATGSPREDSDIDVAVIKKSFQIKGKNWFVSRAIVLRLFC